jgi:tRNA(Arg) A34 adenosine deaminase TadA
MRLAIAAAAKSLKAMDGAPFGACIVKSGRAIAVAGNTVFSQDATCHAEINAIRAASKKLGTNDLSGCVIYSTTEPCPMCFSAIHWSGISCIVFGARISEAMGAGFNELPIPVSSMKRLGGARMEIRSGFLAEECRGLLRGWKDLILKRPELIDRRSPYFNRARRKR